MPPLPGLDLVPYDTSDTIMRIEEVPERLVILGGGFIACEMAHIFDAFGSKVTIVVRGEGLLKQEDAEIAKRITDRLSERMDVIRFATPTSVSMHDGAYLVEVDTPTGLVSVEADRLLVATGRVPNGGQLNVEATGVRLDPNGYVVTDEHLFTGVDGVWPR